MKKLLSVFVAALFAVVSASAFSAAHTGAPMKDEKMDKKAKGDKMDKKVAKKPAKKADGKKKMEDKK